MSKETSKIQIFWCQQIARNTIHKRQTYREITVYRAPAMLVWKSKADVNKEQCDWECK